MFSGWISTNSIMIWSQNAPEKYYTFLAGLTEESLKFTASFSLYRQKLFEFNEPMDAIVYGTLISAVGSQPKKILNMSTTVTVTAESDVQIATIRAVTAVPLHALLWSNNGLLLRYLRIFWSEIVLSKDSFSQ